MNSKAGKLRRGVAIIVVLTAFAVCLGLMASWTRSILLIDRHERLRQKETQMRWLAEAGVARGAIRWRLDRQYAGELWRVDADEMQYPQDAEVQITVEGRQAESPEIRVVAVAGYPAGDAVRVRTTRWIALDADAKR